MEESFRRTGFAFSCNSFSNFSLSVPNAALVSDWNVWISFWNFEKALRIIVFVRVTLCIYSILPSWIIELFALIPLLFSFIFILFFVCNLVLEFYRDVTYSKSRFFVRPASFQVRSIVSLSFSFILDYSPVCKLFFLVVRSASGHRDI